MGFSETPRPAEPADAVERLVADCLALGEALDQSAVERVCRANPVHADALRRRLRQLQHFGLLGDAGALGSGRPRFRHYELLAELGSGGMGVVWLARDRRDGRRVALKTADPRVPWTARMRERFRREVRAASRLDHPNVVPIHEFGEENGLPYYTMEYVEGATLAELIHALERAASPAELGVRHLARAWRDAVARSGAAPSEDAPARWGGTYVQAICRMALDVAEALEHVHRHGVVHRDVKPANVLVGADGRARLFDLGLAHLSDQPALTMTADFAGSPHYASPEQIAGSARELDGRTDVYSLGVTLFEAFALRPPFRGESTPQLLRRIQQRDAPPLRSLSPLVPRDLETVCHACLEKRPEHRYASARELADDLQRFLLFQPVRARPPGGARRVLRRARRNPPLAVAISLALALVLAAPLALWRHEARLRFERDRAGAAAEAARREAEENRQVSAFLESLLLHLGESGDPAHRRAARDLVELAVDRAGGSAEIDATTRASLLSTVASVLSGMGRTAEAVPLLDRAFSARQRELGEDHPSTAEVLRRLADAHAEIGNAGEARALARRSLETLDRAGAPHPFRARARVTLARLLREEGRMEEARRLLDRAEASYREARDVPSAGAARLLRERGELALARGHAEEAGAFLEESRAMLRGLSPPPLEELARAAGALARAHRVAGRFDDARAAWREALGLVRKRAGDRSPEVTAVLRELTEVESLATPEASPAARARHLALLGRHLAAAGDGGAEDAYGAAIELLRDEPGSRSDLGACLVELADLHLAAGREERAAALALEARRWTSPEPSEPWELRCLQQLARLAEPSTAREALELATARLESWDDAVDARFADLFEEQARLLGERGRWQAAARLLERAPAGDEAREEASARLAADPFESLAQRGITALQAARYGEAAEAFRACLELRPGDGVAAYNLACSLALAGRTTAAIDALERAVDNGFGHREGALRIAAEDADLASLRGEPRYRATLERMEERTRAAEAYAFEPAIHLPPGLPEEGPVPLLVVLHADGETKESVLAGPWRRVADELGYALLVPAGRVPVGGDPRSGARWADDLEEYGEHGLFYEEPVRVAFERFRETRPVEPERVFIAGHGLAGALAFNVAVRSPELVRGAILVDAPLHEALAAEKAPHLGAMGFRATLLASVGGAVARDEEVQASLRAARAFRRLRDWGIRASMGAWPAGDDGRDPAEVLARAVRWLE